MSDESSSTTPKSLDPAKFKHTYQFTGTCSSCGTALPLLREIAPAYFAKGYLQCRTCGARLDPWSTALEQVRVFADWMPAALTALGASQTAFNVEVNVGAVNELDLTTYGVARGATVLHVAYTGQDSATSALEWHGNTPVRRIHGTVLRLYGISASQGAKRGLFAVMVTWIAGDTTADIWQFLVDAFEAAANRRPLQLIVPAHSAIEISVMNLITSLLERHTSKLRVREFLRDAATYSHALNMLLPMICDLQRVPRMPDQIRGGLNRLRGFRNDLVHSGIKDGTITDKDAGELLCAVVFGLEYVRYVTPLLLK